MTNQSSLPKVTVPIVFFGAANGGKSTLIGYLVSSLVKGSGSNLGRINSRLKEQYPGFYKSDQYYAYLTDKLPEEIRRNSEAQELGTTKRDHVTPPIKLLEQSSMGHFSINIPLVDTPGAPQARKARFKGFFCGEIGIFVFEIKQNAFWLSYQNESAYLNHSATSIEELSQGLIPLRTWLELPSNPSTIVVLSKCDNSHLPAHEIISKWVRYAQDFCGDLINNVPVLTTSINVACGTDQNVINPGERNKFGDSPDPLWSIIKLQATKIASQYIYSVKSEPSLFTILKECLVEGIGRVYEGKIVSGCFAKGDTINLLPATGISNDEQFENGISATIRSIKEVEGQSVNQASRGDIVGMRLSKFSVSKFRVRRSSIITKDTTENIKGDCLKLRLIKGPYQQDLKIQVLNSPGIVWFGRIIPTQVIAIDDKDECSIIVESHLTCSNSFVMPLDPETGKLMFTEVVVIFNSCALPVKAEVLKIGNISSLDFKESTEKQLTNKRGDKWAEELLMHKSRGREQSTRIHPSSASWVS